MQYITLSDYLLLPIYIALLYFVVKSRSVKYNNTGLKKIYFTAFFLHMLGAILYAMVIQYYYGFGDSLGFFRGSTFLSSITKEDVTFKYFFYNPKELSTLFLNSEVGDSVIGSVINNASNLMIIKISAALSLISFNKYLIISLFFGFFSFIGVWRLFLMFNEISETKVTKILAITILYLPSLWFWGSGLIKDSICMGCLGITTNIFYKLFIKKNIKLLDIIVFIMLLYLLFIVKSYIGATLMASLLAFAIRFFIKNRKSNFEKWAYVLFLLIAGSLIFNYLIAAYLKSIIEDSQVAIDSFKNVYETLDANGGAGSSFMNKSIDFSPTGILIQSPGAIFTTLYRPFIWEIRNLMMLFSSLESLVALLAFLYLMVKLRVFKFFVYLVSDPFIFLSFIFVVILSAIIGFTTFNFGTMVRYRIPILPFYSFMLVMIYIRYKEQKNPSAA